MPEVQKEQNLTARQRGQKGRSGVEAAKVMRGAGQNNKQQQPRRVVKKYPQTASHFDTPSEFLAGPSKPGRMNKGIRRFETAEQDHVAYMLTDEYVMSGAGTRTNKPKVKPANRSGLTLSCEVIAEDPAFRTGHKITHPQAPMDAPYFEDNDPKPPRDEAAVHGKRHVKPKTREENIFLTPGEKDESGNDGQKPAARSVTRTNKANQSRDVINLAQYSREELNEPPEREMVLGPRKFVAPDMPPRRPPAIRQINGRAKDEHDVIGDGRFGKAEETHREGKALGSCRPPKQQANLFAGGAPAHVHKSAEKPAPKVQRNNILRYYDPNMDNADDFRTSQPRRGGNRSNQETIDQPQAQPRRSRGVGECANAHETSLW